MIEDNSRNRKLYIEKTPKALILNGEEYAVISVVDDNNGHYRLVLESEDIAKKFAYPAEFQIIYD